jgi:hypothetical protein
MRILLRRHVSGPVMSLLLSIVVGTLALYAWAAPPSLLSDGENTAKQALTADKVSAFDGDLKFVSQDVIPHPIADADKEVTYTIAGPGAGVKSSVEFRVYDTVARAVKHANPTAAQQLQEANEFDIPRGQFSAYHSNLSGPLAKDVPETFHCIASKEKATWSRCYYYAGGSSSTIVVGTTTSATANEAIMITAMGAQGLAQVKP